jgi:hypothetical protein
MHTELNVDLVLRDLEHQRTTHMEESRRLRELTGDSGTDREAPAGRMPSASGVLRHWPRIWFSLLRRKSGASAAAVA